MVTPDPYTPCQRCRCPRGYHTAYRGHCRAMLPQQMAVQLDAKELPHKSSEFECACPDWVDPARPNRLK